MRVIRSGKENECEPKRVSCGDCLSEIEYDKNDITYGAFGCGEITCPVCGSKIDICDESIELTCDNIEFSKHFMDSEDAIKLDNSEIQKYIRQCLKAAIEDTEHDWGSFYRSGTGDTEVIVMKYDDEYEILVAKNTWLCCIPREKNKEN